MANEKDPHTQTESISIWFSNGLIIMVLLLLSLVVISLLRSEVPDKNRDAIMLIVGGLIGMLTTKINYDFGSSASSARNARRLDKAMESQGQAQQQVLEQQDKAVEKAIDDK